MDRGLQERLVGAAVLVALGVWLIPWVLDGSAVSDSTSNEEIVLKLPAPDDSASAAVRHQTIDLGANRGSLLKSSQADEGATAAPQAPATQTEPTDAAPETLSPVAQSPEAAAPAPQARVVQTPAAEQAVTPAAPAAAQPAPRAPPPIVSASRVDGWMVQLGSFSSSGNAQRQAQRIGTYGHDARIYEFAAAGGRTMFRVRLGPLTSRDRAQATASSLQAHGFVAQVIAPE